MTPRSKALSGSTHWCCSLETMSCAEGSAAEPCVRVCVCVRARVSAWMIKCSGHQQSHREVRCPY